LTRFVSGEWCLCCLGLAAPIVTRTPGLLCKGPCLRLEAVSCAIAVAIPRVRPPPSGMRVRSNSAIAGCSDSNNSIARLSPRVVCSKSRSASCAIASLSRPLQPHPVVASGRSVPSSFRNSSSRAALSSCTMAANQSLI
jgi:hypothetical protein